MFGFLSALVEKGIYDKIFVNFLIVGHTHASIDQYFSVLSKAIKSSYFIPTPLALRQLLLTAHKDSRHQPYLISEITVYYDWADKINSVFNNKCVVSLAFTLTYIFDEFVMFLIFRLFPFFTVL
jgi:hypothetical protein